MYRPRNVVGVAQSVWGLNAGRLKRFMFCEMSQTGCGPTLPFIKWAPCLFLRVKRSGREFKHSSLASAKVMKGWSCTSTQFMCFRGVDKKIF
jgi:hypothetical protein